MSRATTKFGDYSISVDWHRPKGALYDTKKVLLRRIKHAEFQRREQGVVYVEFRKAEEMVFLKDAWTFKASNTMLLKCFNAKFVELHVSNGDIYRITVDALVEQKSIGKMGFWLVPFAAWEFEKGTPESIEKSLSIGKWK